LEVWQRSPNLCATKKTSRAQNKEITAVGYISDMEAIVTASWSLSQHAGAAAFDLSERSPLPPALSGKTSLEDELKYSISAKSEESTVIQLKVTRIVHLKPYPTPKIG